MDTQDRDDRAERDRLRRRAAPPVRDAGGRRRRAGAPLAPAPPPHRARRRPPGRRRPRRRRPGRRHRRRCATPSTRCATPSGRRTSTARRSAAPAWRSHYEDEPDLIAVASDGKKGYCYKTDLDGPPPPTPRRRHRPMSSNLPGMLGYAIPKYESDGTTQIGVFWIGGGGGEAECGRWQRGTRRPPTSTARSSRRRRPSTAPITITREWLDGRTTTNSAEDDPSLSRLAEAERPDDLAGDHPLVPRRRTRRATATPRRPPVAPDWLAERMSAAAREAGDPDAIARWTLTYRRCAAPFEGDAALGDRRGEVELVWIAILHGDFTTWPHPASRPVAAPAGGYGWIYLLLDKDSHEVVSEGASTEPFDTSMFHLQGRTRAGADAERRARRGSPCRPSTLVARCRGKASGKVHPRTKEPCHVVQPRHQARPGSDRGDLVAREGARARRSSRSPATRWTRRPSTPPRSTGSRSSRTGSASPSSPSGSRRAARSDCARRRLRSVTGDGLVALKRQAQSATRRIAVAALVPASGRPSPRTRPARCRRPRRTAPGPSVAVAAR